MGQHARNSACATYYRPTCKVTGKVKTREIRGNSIILVTWLGRWCPRSPGRGGTFLPWGWLYSPKRVVSTPILRRHGVFNSLRNVLGTTANRPSIAAFFALRLQKRASGMSASQRPFVSWLLRLSVSSAIHLSSQGLLGPPLRRSNLRIYFKIQSAGRWITGGLAPFRRCQIECLSENNMPLATSASNTPIAIVACLTASLPHSLA